MWGGKGWETADDWAALFACVIIAFNGVGMVNKALRDVMDTAVAADFENEVRTIALAVPGVGALDKVTMRHFDASCIAVPESFRPQQIKRIRESQRVSQPIFARTLNTSESTVEKWESGVKKPSGMAVKLLSIVQKHGLQMLA